jgi:hypothetical protein
MDAPNFVFTAKISLLTLSLCNIEDFSQTMSHIQYIMGTSVIFRFKLEWLSIFYYTCNSLHHFIHNFGHENAVFGLEKQ